jgi:predicted Zn-ribbon and HTH transcriptional regulator
MTSDPPDRSRTVRQALLDALESGPWTALELSAAVGAPERDVLDHLKHLARSTHHRRKLVVEPARCLACGFVFEQRSRLNRPSRCPACKGERLSSPRFLVR